MSEGTQIAENAGPTAKPKFVSKIEGLLNDGEEVYHIIRGPHAGTGDTQFSADNKSTGTKGFVTTAFTDTRVLVRVPHFFADDRYSIQYEKIQGVELNSELVGNRSFTVHTSGKSYWIGVMGSMSSDDLHEIQHFVDRVISQNINQTPSSLPQVRLEQLTKLRDNGYLSEDEYESKRSEIISEI